MRRKEEMIMKNLKMKLALVSLTLIPTIAMADTVDNNKQKIEETAKHIVAERQLVDAVLPSIHSLYGKTADLTINLRADIEKFKQAQIDSAKADFDKNSKETDAAKKQRTLNAIAKTVKDDLDKQYQPTWDAIKKIEADRTVFNGLKSLDDTVESSDYLLNVARKNVTIEFAGMSDAAPMNAISAETLMKRAVAQSTSLNGVATKRLVDVSNQIAAIRADLTKTHLLGAIEEKKPAPRRYRAEDDEDQDSAPAQAVESGPVTQPDNGF